MCESLLLVIIILVVVGFFTFKSLNLRYEFERSSRLKLVRCLLFESPRAKAARFIDLGPSVAAPEATVELLLLITDDTVVFDAPVAVVDDSLGLLLLLLASLVNLVIF